MGSSGFNLKSCQHNKVVCNIVAHQSVPHFWCLAPSMWSYWCNTTNVARCYSIAKIKEVHTFSTVPNYSFGTLLNSFEQSKYDQKLYEIPPTEKHKELPIFVSCIFYYLTCCVLIPVSGSSHIMLSVST